MAAVAVLSLGALACGRQEEPSAAARGLLTPLQTPEGFEPGKVSLTGKVTLSGAPPSEPATFETSGDPYCRQHGPIPNESWKVSADGGLADVVITVADAPPTVPVPAPEIVQEGCRYLPHVAAITAGQSVRVSNLDPTFHNVRVVSHQKGTLNRGSNLANYSQPGRGDANEHPFTQSGIYRLECDVHRWMRSWIFVADNNHLAVSRPGGTFQLDRGLRDGSYVVQAWHHHFAEPLTQSVDVIGGRAEVNFQFDVQQALN